MISKKINFQTGSLIYLAINVLYILPMAVFLWGHIVIPTNKFLTLYVITMLYYWAFFLTYAHIIFSIILIVYSVRQFIKDKKTWLLVSSLAVTLADIAVNVYWALNGRQFTTV